MNKTNPRIEASKLIRELRRPEETVLELMLRALQALREKSRGLGLELVLQDWILPLPMQQQSVLMLACRGPDGIGKLHKSKPLVCLYRAAVLKSARMGRPLRIDECEAGSTFMTLAQFFDDAVWVDLVKQFFNCVDEVPHHYYMHLAHGAEIIGYKHPDPLFRKRWINFYYRCTDNLHMFPETEVDLDSRLNDWGRQGWGLPEAAE